VILSLSLAHSIKYPADASQSSADLGRDDVLKRLSTRPTACPDQKYALVGYSQGALVMHMASTNLSLNVFPRVVALVMFGDPGFKENTRVRAFPVYLGSRLLENCAEGDPVSVFCLVYL
jgi:cutinase